MTALEVALAALASAILARQAPLGADYANVCRREFCDDSAAAVSGVAHGHLSALWDHQPTAGPVSIVLRAPFAALAQLGSDSALTQYRLGSFACLFASALLALWIASTARRRGAAAPLCALLVAGLILNPLTFRALDLGHPEEPLAAMLAVFAVVATSERRVLAGAVAFGAALATKQWALLAAGPLLLAAPRASWLPSIGIAVAVAAVLFAPVALGNPSRFHQAQQEAASPHANATPTNVWWSLARVDRSQRVAPGSAALVPPRWVRTLSHWLVLALAAAASAVLLARSRHPDLAIALVLASLLFLLRCVLDPYTFSYHHWPFIAAVGAYEVVGKRRFPFLAAIASLVLWYISYHVAPSQPVDQLFHWYLAWSVPMTAVLVVLSVRETRR